MTTLTHSYAVLPLRDIVVFPHMIVPLFVGREKSVRALEDVMAGQRIVWVEGEHLLQSISVTSAAPKGVTVAR